MMRMYICARVIEINSQRISYVSGMPTEQASTSVVRKDIGCLLASLRY